MAFSDGKDLLSDYKMTILGPGATEQQHRDQDAMMAGASHDKAYKDFINFDAGHCHGTIQIDESRKVIMIDDGTDRIGAPGTLTTSADPSRQEPTVAKTVIGITTAIGASSGRLRLSVRPLNGNEEYDVNAGEFIGSRWAVGEEIRVDFTAVGIAILWFYSH